MSGKIVLELGAGIGRFTTYFATQANSVTAVDFNQNFIDTNKKNNSNFSNISYQCKNVNNLSFAIKNFDFIFINWLLISLTQKDLLVANNIKKLKDDAGSHSPSIFH